MLLHDLCANEKLRRLNVSQSNSLYPPDDVAPEFVTRISCGVVSSARVEFILVESM